MGILSMFGGQLADLALQHLDPMEKGLCDLINQIENPNNEQPCFMLVVTKSEIGTPVILAVPCTLGPENIATQTSLEVAGDLKKVFPLKNVLKNIIKDGL